MRNTLLRKCYTPITFPHFPMSNNTEIEKKIEQFLSQLGVPGFVVFGWNGTGDEFQIVSSFKDIPPNAAIKGLSWALHDFINKTL